MISNGFFMICHEAPNKFLEKTHKFFMSELELTGHALTINDKLSNDIWNKFKINKQTRDTFCNKMHLWNQLNKFIKINFDNYALFVGGSTLNGFGLENSDVDMSLLDKNSSFSEKYYALNHLGCLLIYLSKYDKIYGINLIKAVVPVLNFYEKQFNLTVDINYNKTINIYNTYLLYCYSKVDWRVQPLVIIIKIWAKSQNINSAKDKTLSSYVLILMVIHFLQFGVTPPVLPCLQKLFPEKFKFECDSIQKIDFFEELNITRYFLRSNEQSLGNLLIAFFKYYNNFDFKHCIISVRLGSTIRVLNNYRTCLYVEEPFDCSNVAKSVYDSFIFQRIKRIIDTTYKKLIQTQNLANIKEIFNGVTY